MSPRSGASDARAPGLAFACIAPHGDLAIPEACPGDTVGLARATQEGMRELARRFDEADPEVVVVLTPHGIHVEGHLAVVVAGRTAGALDDAPGVALDVPVDRALALAIVRELGIAGIPAVGVSFGGNDPAEAVMPLDWGSLIPLWYLGGRRDPPVPVVVIAPARDLPVESHVAAGAAIDEAAAVLDALVVSILRDGRLGALRDLDPALVDAAKPDSPWQMLMLLGALGETWTPRLLSYEAPTYYGMLCAAFEPPGGA